MSANPPHTSDPQKIGEYQVLQELGIGGMGAVYKAQHIRMERIVAIKVLNQSALETEEAIGRFHREVKTSAKLDHPNLIRSFDAGESDGLHFLVMEYVDGTDLEQLVEQKGVIPPEQAIAYIKQAGEGLAYVHREGIVHRDIKPANLMLDRDGRIKIGDLGLASMRSAEGIDSRAETGLTHTDTVMGTAAYMAPEQAMRLRDADARADIYSLGCTLFYMLTRREPYVGDSFVEVVVAHREEPIPSIRDINPNVSPALDAVCRRMMAKKPADRYQSVEEAVEELEAALTGKSTKSVSPSSQLMPLVESLEAADLLTRQGVGEFLGGLEAFRRPDTPEQLANLLAQRGIISTYQATVLLKGKAEELNFQDYVLLDQLSKSDRAALYKAQHRQTRATVALKAFTTQYNWTEESIASLREETQKAKAVVHENLIEIYGVGVKKDCPYVTSEFFDATDLRILVKRYGPLGYELAVHYLWQAAAGISEAHRQGIVHFDLKPSNVLVDEEGRLKITDLGYAELRRQQLKHNPLAEDASAGASSLFQTIPTVDYSAPELVAHPDRADHRADLYSLGCLFFFALTGLPVYRSSTSMAAQSAHANEPVPRLSEFQTDAPGHFQQVFDRMLAKNPAQRYTSADELLGDLELVFSAPDPSSRDTVSALAGDTMTAELGGSSINTQYGSSISGGSSISAPYGSSIHGSSVDLSTSNSSFSFKAEQEEAKADAAAEEEMPPLGQLAAVVAVLFAVFMPLAYWLQPDHLPPFIGLQVLTASLLAGTIWHFRSIILGTGRIQCVGIGLAIGLVWGMLYAGFNLPFADELGFFLHSKGLAVPGFDPFVGSLIAIVLLGLGCGLTFGILGRWATIFLGLGFLFPAMATGAYYAHWGSLDAETAAVEGELFYEYGRFHKAIKYLDRSLQMSPEQTKPLRIRGLSYFELGKFNEAIADFNKLIEAKPDAKLHMRRALAYRELGHDEKALDDLSLAIKLDPTNPVYYEARGDLLREAGMEDRALQDIAKAIILRKKEAAKEAAP